MGWSRANTSSQVVNVLATLLLAPLVAWMAMVLSAVHKSTYYCCGCSSAVQPPLHAAQSTMTGHLSPGACIAALKQAVLCESL